MFTLTRRHASTFVAVLGFVSIAAPVRAQTSGANGTHDPSRMLESDGKVYIYSTGGGTMVSSDGLVWATGSAPSWNKSLLANNEGIWAPDGIHLNGQYYLYYAMYAADKSSAIGLVTSPTLDPGSPSYKWTDHGAVVAGPAGSTFSTIDPCPVLDADGNLWLSWGGGYPFSTTANSIWLTRLDNTTGLPLTSDPAYQPPASPGHPLEQGHKEGSYVYYHGGYYYLFWQTGSCCSGTASTYEINLARATAITGPYTGDRIFYATNGNVHGPGQIGIYSCGGVERFTYHYYPTAESVLGENELTWSSDDWPVAGAPATTPLQLPCAQTTPPLGDDAGAVPDDASTSDADFDAARGSRGDAAVEGSEASVGGAASDGGYEGGATTTSGSGGEAGSAAAGGSGGGTGDSGTVTGGKSGQSSGCACGTGGVSSNRGGLEAPIGLIGLLLVTRRRRAHHSPEWCAAW
jgi:arabinan endo-1,5-alpha-L-arabinosidase